MTLCSEITELTYTELLEESLCGSVHSVMNFTLSILFLNLSIPGFDTRGRSSGLVCTACSTHTLNEMLYQFISNI